MNWVFTSASINFLPAQIIPAFAAAGIFKCRPCFSVTSATICIHYKYYYLLIMCGMHFPDMIQYYLMLRQYWVVWKKWSRFNHGWIQIDMEDVCTRCSPHIITLTIAALRMHFKIYKCLWARIEPSLGALGICLEEAFLIQGTITGADYTIRCHIPRCYTSRRQGHYYPSRPNPLPNQSSHNSSSA